MTTIKINDHYDVTLHGPRKLAKGYEVEGTIWNRETNQSTGIRVRGEGRTITAAQDRARAQAVQKCPIDPPKPRASRKKG